MQLLLKYDPYDTDYSEDDWMLIEDDLEYILERIFDKYDGIQFTGNLGLWNGPHPVEAKIWDIKKAKDLILDQDVIELWYMDDEADVSEIQRYSGQWKMHADKGCMLLKQWHHDGCNILTIRPIGKELNMTFSPEEVGIYGE